MRKTTESIPPEFVIRMLAYGILAGVAIIVIYAAQAFFAQPAVKPSPPVTAVRTVATSPPTSPTPSAAQPAAAGQPAQVAPPAPAGQAATRPAGGSSATSAPRVEAAATTKAPAQAAPAAKSRVEPQPVGKALAVLGTGLLLAGAALLGGALLGFLFGIPRSLQQQGAVEPVPAEGASTPPKGTAGRGAYGANTSLEQISDWLTKILVGVGLTQLSSLPSSLTQFADFAIPGLGGFETSGVFAVAMLIYFVTCGFLMSYLWTRLKLGKAFGEADTLSAIRGEIETTVATEVQKAQEQMTIDYEALRLTQKQLESGDVSQAELDKAFHGTSDIYRKHIFQLASTTRSDNWREPGKKKIMERTIPIFRALIATDPKPERERYFQNYAQLGFALAESDPPDYPNASAALEKAIDLRGSPEAHGYLWNEFVHAKCLADPKSHDPETKERVLKDLGVALKLWPDLAGVVQDDERLSAWMKANHVSLKSLLSQDT